MNISLLNLDLCSFKYTKFGLWLPLFNPTLTVLIRLAGNFVTGYGYLFIVRRDKCLQTLGRWKGSKNLETSEPFILKFDDDWLVSPAFWRHIFLPLPGMLSGQYILLYLCNSTFTPNHPTMPGLTKTGPWATFILTSKLQQSILMSLKYSKHAYVIEANMCTAEGDCGWVGVF